MSVFYVLGAMCLGLPLVAQSVKNQPAMQETWVQFLGQEASLEKEMATHPTILAWKIMDRGLVVHRSWSRKESHMTEHPGHPYLGSA